MAFSGNFMCTTFKKELLYGVHDFKGDTMKIALYTNSASFNAATTAYTATNEASGTNYSSGGNTLTKVDPTVAGTTALTDFSDSTWSSSTITARGALIYNSTPNTTSLSVSNPSIIILDFGSDKSSSSGDFKIVFPAADASNAIIRIA